MKTVYALFFAFALLVVLSSCSRPPAPSRQNHSFEYNLYSVAKHDLRAEGDSLHIYFFSADTVFFAYPKNMRVAYATYLNYESRDQTHTDTVAMPWRHFNRSKNGIVFDFKVAKAKLKLPAVLLLKFTSRNDPEHALIHDIPLTEKVWEKSFIVLNGATNLPLFRNYLETNETVIISRYGNNPTGDLIRYEGIFTPALPPMVSSSKTSAQPTLKPVETIVFGDKPVFLLQPGLYGIKIDNKIVGGILKAEGSFPELTSAPELIQPLIYLTTSAEREKLYKNTDPKAAVDKFWLNITPNQSQARLLIKTYYGHVTAANKLFTAHKPGWQTDRGLIYVVFGNPDIVQRHQHTEEWTYLATTYHNEVRFVFSRKDNTFTQNHYELVRSSAYEPIWYGTVEQWRNGTIEK